jgi:hypothetical protein
VKVCFAVQRSSAAVEPGLRFGSSMREQTQNQKSILLFRNLYFWQLIWIKWQRTVTLLYQRNKFSRKLQRKYRAFHNFDAKTFSLK